MHGSKQNVPITLETDDVIIHEIEWGDMHIGFENFHQETDVAPLLKGLPDDRCQCPHWGYVIRGEMRVRYNDHEEVIRAGDAYYLAPGHAPLIAPGTEIVEFSPKHAYQQTMDVVMHNFEAMS